MKKAVVGLMVLLLAALAVSAAQGRTGQSHRMPHTTAPDTYVNIKVLMTDDKITMSRHTGPQGSDARFIVRNVGKTTQTMQLGDKKRGLGFQAGFHTTVKPGEKKILILYLDYRGAKVPYFSKSPGSQKMHKQGIFTVGACLQKSTASIDTCDVGDG